MKIIVLLSCFAVTLALPTQQVGVAAGECSNDACKLDEGCRCSSASGPIQNLNDAPQLISLTFDDAVTQNIYSTYWEPLLFHRTNPDGQPIGATFFVPHEYTDYERVNDLYNYGFEIGVHSITKNNLQSYWRNADEELLEKEFGGQRQIIAKFANIPAEDIIGARTPQLQLAGNASIQAYVNSGLKYDSSWPTLPRLPLFPYSLDYLSSQQCNLGSACPNEAFPNFWVLPILDLNGKEGECNTLASCNVTGTADEIAEWLLAEINKVRTATKVPLTLLVNSYWFDFTANSYEGFYKTLDKLAEYPDVFFVTQKQVHDWIKNPVPISEFETEFPERTAGCNPYACKLVNQESQERYLNACVSCPATYPWLGNPNGDVQ